ncbi:MAG: hypothetical protein ABSH08_09830 [Tepidisphaeraceae bacterium]|jgi:hypothetical protein
MNIQGHFCPQNRERYVECTWQIAHERLERWGPKAQKIISFFSPLLRKNEPKAEEQFKVHLALLLDEVHEDGRAEYARELRQLLNEGK